MTMSNHFDSETKRINIELDKNGKYSVPLGTEAKLFVDYSFIKKLCDEEADNRERVLQLIYMALFIGCNMGQEPVDLMKAQFEGEEDLGVTELDEYIGQNEELLTKGATNINVKDRIIKIYHWKGRSCILAVINLTDDWFELSIPLEDKPVLCSSPASTSVLVEPYGYISLQIE